MRKQKPLRVALISCTKTKRPGVHTAKDIYSSPRFKLIWQYVEPRYDCVFILSAKHGLLPPERRIRAYDETMHGRVRRVRERWARKVERQIRAHIPRGAHIEFWCGAAYWGPLKEALERDYAVRTPLAHLRQGEQLQRIKRAIESSHPSA